ncbi:nucleoside deaminase [Streptomyces anulatus]|uniref:nucleoside deaminase n=1 Tax=Streptomyces anulatus TaxID=1892 RepID=UPI0033D09992
MSDTTTQNTATEADVTHLHTAVAVARRSRSGGNHPFGALLAGPDGTILLEAENTVTTDSDATGHAETNLVRLSTAKYDAEFLAACTLYTSTEPCAMCSGAIYWGNIGRVVYALGEDELLDLTGANEENPTMSLPCRTVFAAGQRDLPVVGPVDLPEAREVHAGFWN